jgi:hypothetical protein
LFKGQLPITPAASVCARCSMTDLFCRILRGESVAWTAKPALDAAELLRVADQEGVHLLISHRLCRAGSPESCPEPLRAHFERALYGELATEQITRRELRDVIAALCAEDVRPLLFKGAALAFTHYPDPALRPRVDVDLLVSSDEIHRAAQVLQRLGYSRSLCIAAELVGSKGPSRAIDRYLASSQVSLCKTDGYGVEHVFDLHWKVSIPQVFANVLSLKELLADSIAVPSLGAAARCVGPVHALAIACIHRVAHHHGNDRLIWLYDIHLLAEALRPSEGDAFFSLAISNRISAVCAHGLSLAQRQFGTTLPAGLLERLEGHAAPRNGQEPSSAYLRRQMRKVDVLRSDLAALESWRQRFRLLAQHVFPPAAYVQKAYGVSNRSLVPALYAWRVIEGARGWFRNGRRGTH